MAASLLLPLLIFTFASWTTYRNLHALAKERLIRSLDIQQEQATKTFELIDMTVKNASDILTGLSATSIRTK